MKEIKENKTPVTKKKIEEVVSTKERLIYIGPNMLSLTAFTVLESGYPHHIEVLVKKCPDVGKLFVPISELAEAQSRTQRKGTIEHRRFTKVLEYISNERKQGE